jgi:hypothetical protein
MPDQFATPSSLDTPIEPYAPLYPVQTPEPAVAPAHPMQPWQQPVWPAQYYPQSVPAVQQVVNVGYGPRRCRHGLHFLLTLITGGLWLPIWIIDALAKGK